MYYGNVSVLAASNGPGTFIQFSDFASSAGLAYGTGWTVGSGLASWDGASAVHMYFTTPITESQYRVKTKVRVNGNARIFIGAEANSPYTGTDETGAALYSNFGTYPNTLFRVNSGTPNLGTRQSFTVSNMTWYDLEIIIDDINTKYISNAYLSGASTPSQIVEYDTKGPGTGNTFGWYGVGSEYYDVSLVYVRKYTPTEPSTSLGSEVAATGSLNISSIPTGANLYIDNVLQLSTTNAIITGLSTGSHSYKLTKAGYEDYTDSFTINPDSTTTLSITMLSASIGATLMTVTPSETPCRIGICTVTVNVTWHNGGGNATFTPSILIDGTPHLLPTESLAANGTISHEFIISGLSAGTHPICPNPN
jgi:hypothetical protein